jgi:hypothetical protein
MKITRKLKQNPEQQLLDVIWTWQQVDLLYRISSNKSPNCSNPISY